jgi:Tfp pilus assembly protein PilF
VELFERAVALDPEYAMAHRELGWALSREKEKDAEAEYHLRRAVELNDEDGWAHIYLGNIRWRRGDLSSAEQSFRNAIEVWPEIAIPYWCLALFYEYVGRTEDAIRLYQQGVAVDPDDVQANKMFGIYLNDQGETERARAYIERALALNPEDKSLVEILAKTR